MPELRLEGCGSRPLLGYLKALGILRIIGRQADPSARGRWRGGVFELRSDLDCDGLERFLLDSYIPSPVMSPWNGGSGFHPKDNRAALQTIEESTGERLDPYRRAIASARESLGKLSITAKPSPETKVALIRSLRRSVPDAALTWIDAAVVMREQRLAFPPLLGSGGNDGRFEFSNNYAHCVVDCLLKSPAERTVAGLAGALWDLPVALDRKLSLAHFRRDSSPNNSPHGEADSLGNPWDLVLAVEGTLLLVAGAARRHGAGMRGSLVAPFTARPTTAGYGSAVEGESGRAELWLPLWKGWASLAEISTLARESRAQVGGGHPRRASTGLDFARAAGELGVARGIDSFERYALLERAGQSNLAVPVGRIEVKSRPAAEALGGLDRWLDRTLRFGHGEHCPQGPRIAIRSLERAAFEMAARGTAADVCATLEALGTVEAKAARSGQASQFMRPLSGAPAKPWIDAIAADGGGSHELAVAVAVASLRDRRTRADSLRHRRDGDAPALRDYLHGTKTGEKGTEFDPSRRHAVIGGDPVAVLAALQARRHLDAARRDSGSPQLGYRFGATVPIETARLFATPSGLDYQRIFALVRGLALLDFDGSERAPAPRSSWAAPQPAFDLLALAWHHLGARPGWAARLGAGAVQAVLDDAALRLRMAGLPPLADPADLMVGIGEPHGSGQRLSAALLLRLEPGAVRRLTATQIHKDHENHETKDVR